MDGSYQINDTPTAARQFEFEVRRLADSLVFGGDPSPFVGAGLEYAESRPYEPGDPIRSIDWRVTARTQRHFVKQYEATRQMPIYLLVDGSGSMCVGSTRPTKYEWAVRLSAALAVAAQERMSPVGLLDVGGRGLHVRPTLSRSAAMTWAHQLRFYTFSQRTCLTERLRTLAASLQQRSLVLVLSDLHDVGVMDSLELVAANHEVIVLWLEDPTEKQWGSPGFFRAREAETGQRFLLSQRSQLPTHVRIRSQLADGGIEFLHLPIDEPVVAPLQHFLRHRKSMGHA